MRQDNSRNMGWDVLTILSGIFEEHYPSLVQSNTDLKYVMDIFRDITAAGREKAGPKFVARPVSAKPFRAEATRNQLGLYRGHDNV